MNSLKTDAYSDFFHGHPLPMVIFDRDFRLEEFNAKAADILAMAGEISLGTSAADFLAALSPATREAPDADDGVTTESAETKVTEAMMVGADRLPTAVLADGRVFAPRSHRLPSGRYQWTIEFEEDEVREDTKLNLGTLSLLQDASNALEEGFSLWDQDMRFLLCNQKYTEMIFEGRSEDVPTPGTHANDAIGLQFDNGTYDLPSDLTRERYIADLIAWVASYGKAKEFSFADGRTVVVSCNKTKLGGYLLTALDITDIKEAERRSLETLQDASESLEEGFALWDSNGCFLLSNDLFYDMIWPNRDDGIPVGTPIAELVRQLYRNDTIEVADDLSEKVFVDLNLKWMREENGVREFRTREGRTLVGRCNVTKQGGYLLTILDVTKERSAEDNAREMLLDALQSIDAGVVLCDEELNFVFGNKAWKSMQFKGFEHIVPRTGERVTELLKRLIDAGYYAMPDGFGKTDFANSMKRAMSRYGEPFAYSSSDGRHFIGSAHETGFGGSLLFFRDVTDQRRAEDELESQRDIAHQNEKLSALGELLAGVAHELNNPLSIIVGYSQMLQGQLKDPKLEQRIDRINQAAERSARIIKTFLAMARQRPSKIEFCQIGEVVEIALDVAGYSLRSRGGNIEYDLPDGLPAVAVDKDQLAQVFSNLLINAEQATAALGSDAQVHVQVAHDRAAAQVCVTVTDNGSGIAEDVKARIFEPFFTTKDPGEGTGFGLAFAHRIVTEHQGEIRVESQPGSGSRFEIRLPALAAAKSRPQTHSDRMLAGSGERVLVVD
ncbi:MAG: PAS-domain containing protein, partial [Pseudomonadota bacterium]